MQETLKTITETIEGWKVKELRFLPLDNIIVGLVEDKQFGSPRLYDGFVSCQWTKQGKPLKFNKGRKELILKMDL